MKKLFIIFTLLLFATGAWAADSKLSALTALEAAPAGTDQLYINDGGVSKLITIDYLFDYIEANILTLTGNWVNTANPWADNEVSDTLTATTIVVADNESTDEENALIFSSGGDVDGGSYQLESDGNATYNPSTGTITATQFSGGGAGLTAVDAATGDSATDFFDAGEIADARIANDITASNYVPLSGFTQDSGILVGTGAGTYAEETGATLRTSIGAQATLTNEAGLYSALSDVSDFVQTSEIDSAAELESVANLGAYFSDLADDADAATMRTTLGIDTAANLETNLSLGAFASDLLGYASAAAVLSGISAAPLDSPTFTTDVTVGAGVPVVMGSYYWEYESAAGPEKLANSLMLYDGSDDALFGIDGTNGTIYFKSSLTPSVNLFDSSSDTAETNLVDIRADQYAGGMGADFTTVTATEEVSDVFIYYQDAGTKREAIWIDGSADTTYFGYAGQDGKIGIYSEQGETDYQVTFAPHATMTETTAYVLPAAFPESAQYLQSDDAGNLAWASPEGSGDVTGVGDCTGGDCLDGTDDGGTNILFYDAQGATTLQGGDTAGAITLTLPTATGTLLTSNANTIDSDQYVDGSIDAVHLAADVIDETKIADDGIDSEHYNDDSIDEAHINWAEAALENAIEAAIFDADSETFGASATATTSFIAPLFDAAGDEDLDIGSADVDDITLVTDGGTYVFDADLTISDSSGIVLSDNNTIILDATPDGMDDGEYNGITITGINHGETVGALKCVFLASDGKVDIADADAAGEFPAIGLSVNGGDDTDAAIILTRGIVRDEDWTGLTVGGAVYLSEDGTGQITQTAPSDADDCVQLVGRAISDSEIYFNFSGHWLLVE